jgi:hypothetical protein
MYQAPLFHVRYEYDVVFAVVVVVVAVLRKKLLHLSV